MPNLGVLAAWRAERISISSATRNPLKTFRLGSLVCEQKGGNGNLSQPFVVAA